MSWRAALTLVLLVAAVLSGWSVWRHRERPPEQAGTAGRPDYVLHDFELVALDDKGQESFTLRAPTMLRNPGERSMEMATPVFLLPDSERHYWQVVAEEGWVGPEGQELRLTGDVRVTSPPEERNVAMNTEQLNIFPDTDMAIAPGVVTITQPGSILRGRGLETNLSSKRYELKSQVQSRYVPH
ncbi:MAG TPA: LPS export ABC transporter periplasmic protein LptC [Luteimonas sp.]|nr:LPS export ABC transporter periplasmic protein LptC [Luteimonas sp.]